MARRNSRVSRAGSSYSPNRIRLPLDPLADLLNGPVVTHDRGMGRSPISAFEPSELDQTERSPDRMAGGSIFAASSSARPPGPRRSTGKSVDLSHWPSANVQEIRRAFECARRQERKEVLFARNVAGKAGGSPGPYKLRRSKESC